MPPILPALAPRRGDTNIGALHGEGVLASVGLFDNSEQAHESTRLAATWVRHDNLESALPNPPKITAGAVIAQAMAAAALSDSVPSAS